MDTFAKEAAKDGPRDIPRDTDARGRDGWERERERAFAARTCAVEIERSIASRAEMGKKI